MRPAVQNSRQRALSDLSKERDAQDAKWGSQSHPNGTGPERVLFGVKSAQARDRAQRLCDFWHSSGSGTWFDILLEEVLEAFAEDDPVRIREELVQAGAVIVSWIEDMDRKQAGGVSSVTATMEGT